MLHAALMMRHGLYQCRGHDLGIERCRARLSERSRDSLGLASPYDCLCNPVIGSGMRDGASKPRRCGRSIAAVVRRRVVALVYRNNVSPLVLGQQCAIVREVFRRAVPSRMTEKLRPLLRQRQIWFAYRVYRKEKPLESLLVIRSRQESRHLPRV